MEQRNLRILKPIGHNNNSFICWNFGSFTSISLAKGGIMSEDIGGFLPLPKNIPKNYLQLSYPVHGNDKVF